MDTILTIIRTDFDPKFTRGLLDINGQYFCRTLEDTDRRLELRPTEKVYGETCIPRGKYVLVIDFSHRFQRLMPHVLGVQHFDGIRIHNGSYPKDTLGCPLVGKNIIPGGINKSVEAFEELMDVLMPIHKNKEKMWLEIK